MNMGIEVNMIAEAVYSHQIIKLPRHQMLIYVSHHDEMFAGVLEKEGVEVGTEEMDRVTHAQQERIAMSRRQSEEHYLGMTLHLDIKSLMARPSRKQMAIPPKLAWA